jgi:hypothetical protein
MQKTTSVAPKQILSGEQITQGFLAAHDSLHDAYGAIPREIVEILFSIPATGTVSSLKVMQLTGTLAPSLARKIAIMSGRKKLPAAPKSMNWVDVHLEPADHRYKRFSLTTEGQDALTTALTAFANTSQAKELEPI